MPALELWHFTLTPASECQAGPQPEHPQAVVFRIQGRIADVLMSGVMAISFHI